MLRVDCSGRRVASLDVDGVIKVWSFNPIMQTKASSISKSPLLSLEWATKRDRLVSSWAWCNREHLELLLKHPRINLCLVLDVPRPKLYCMVLPEGNISLPMAAQHS